MEPLIFSRPGGPIGEPGIKPKVLAVDDQPDSLRLLQMRLQASGMECAVCRDGQSALRYLAEHDVDVVILDVMMPQMDGFEVCRRIKADERTRNIPVLFLTARLDKSDKIRGLEVGGHDYLSKPIEQQELMARTRAAVRVKQLQDQLKEQITLQQRINQLHQEMLSEHWQKTFGQLAASLAHEINNPLAAALGSVQLLKLEEELGLEMRQRLDVIDQSLQRAGHKLHSLLLIAQTGKQAQMVSLSRLVEDIVTLSNFLAVVNKVTLVPQLTQECLWLGPSSELARAGLYLMNNAIEAASISPNGQVTIRVDRDDQRQYIRIIDNGNGIPESIKGRIFEAFFTTKGPPHNGVGLFLASEIVKSLGGTIEMRSPASDAATEFSIALPLMSSSNLGIEAASL
ncbi:MAG TPA: hybrid sensor histidine kinase/response regulator [Candidatus Paceibacterota bacterium]|nr:hybrid sensor histidine kinase/response regulator [Verrucomicrobiota bacterium]HRY50056.1 hybrid sensor histidine kinase/response regulator [Candidatus Paceibacterota bacterium]